MVKKIASRNGEVKKGDKINFGVSGNKYINCKTGIPSGWLSELNVTKDFPYVILKFEDNMIVLEKAEDPEAKDLKINKIMFHKSGNNYIGCKLSIPYSWIKEMQITEEEPYIIKRFQENKIIIEKDNS